MRRLSEAFDFTARLAEPEIALAVPAVDPAQPTAAERADWLAFLQATFKAIARDSSGTGIMATAERIVPAVRLLDALADPGQSGEAPLPTAARDAVLSALAAYEQALQPGRLGGDLSGIPDCRRYRAAASDRAGPAAILPLGVLF